ncbi:cupin domain-containing protein [uncultured Ilyobacter sp.]|uniref:cupin domain-containing protein n=1 Tax=uncultured Ilyobacter sp. TaxID=544433 RepID=UPI0029C97B55|nr:cupin domain-containing protein [uncultured Ilyobacter sp.]
MSKILKVENLEEMINYQEGSVVSKILIGKKNGTVTLFSFDKGQVLSEHTAPFDAMVEILDGKAAITVSGTEYNLEKRDMLIMPADEPHALRADEKFKMLLTMIK